jgi:hypothetical protein
MFRTVPHVCLAGVLALLVAAPACAGSREPWSPQPLTVRHHWRRPAYLAPVAAPIVVPVVPGLGFQTPFFDVLTPDGDEALVRIPHYQGPDGAYDSLADLTNEIQGTPCGRECTEQSMIRWGYEPVR